jgi:hypothetical protein
VADEVLKKKENRRYSIYNINLRVISVVNEESFLFIEIVDGKSISVERIAPKATNKCNHRTEASVGRVHKRLYSASIPTIQKLIFLILNSICFIYHYKI